eukprot:XP_014047652.1 PREDICTED: C-type lectin domain family 10 member A-like [Salmo salar]
MSTNKDWVIYLKEKPKLEQAGCCLVPHPATIVICVCVVTASGCCPLGWVLSGSSSCYFFSSDGLPWNQARDFCSNYNAHLAVLKTKQDWDFVTGGTKPLFFWIGLSDERTGDWEWVDGSPYIMDRSQWKPGQPDNWKGHGLGGTEDCAMIHANGQLNDDHCSRSYRYVCQGHTLTHT